MKEFCDTIATSTVRYAKYRCWASIGVWPPLPSKRRRQTSRSCSASLEYGCNLSDLFVTRPFFLFAAFAGHPSSSSLTTFSPFSPPRKVLSSVEESAQHRAWRGAGSGWTFPRSSGRKFLPEICVKKGQPWKMRTRDIKAWQDFHCLRVTRSFGPHPDPWKRTYSGKSKALVFFRVWSFNMHAPYILSADDLGDVSGSLCRKPSIMLEADDLLGACYRKAMTPQKLWTLLAFFPQFRTPYGIRF